MYNDTLKALAAFFLFDSFLLAALAPLLCFLVSSFFDFGFRNYRRNLDRLAILIDGHKGKISRKNVLSLACFIVLR